MKILEEEIQKKKTLKNSRTKNSRNLFYDNHKISNKYLDEFNINN